MILIKSDVKPPSQSNTAYNLVFKNLIMSVLALDEAFLLNNTDSAG